MSIDAQDLDWHVKNILLANQKPIWYEMKTFIMQVLTLEKTYNVGYI